MGALPQLFNQLATDGVLVPWLHRCVTSLGLRGNAFGLVVSRDGFGFPTAIEWLDPTDVMVDERPGQTGWLWRGRNYSMCSRARRRAVSLMPTRCAQQSAGCWSSRGSPESFTDSRAGWPLVWNIEWDRARRVWPRPQPS